MSNSENIGVAIQAVANASSETKRKPRAKPVYECRDVKLVNCSDLRPDVPNLEGKQVLVGEMLYQGEWRPLRTSIVVGYDDTTKCYETLNSIYRVVE